MLYNKSVFWERELNRRHNALAMNRWLQMYLLLLLVGGILYGVVGPLVDQHFAERLPYHGHLYLSGLPKAHTHLYYKDPPSDPGASHQQQGIVFLPGTDIQHDGMAVWAWPITSLSLMLAPILLSVLIGLGPRWRLLSALVAPPDKPPRLFA